MGQKNKRISRREFLQVASGVAAGLLVGVPREGRASAPRRVVVLGAGLGGLAAAEALLAADPSCRVTVIEARRRVGGRVETLRAGGDRPFADNQYAEGGAHRILPSHDRTLAWIRHFGLAGKLVEYGPGDFAGKPSPGLFVLRGERFDGRDGWPARLALSAEERAGHLRLHDGASFDYARRLYPAVHGTEVLADGAEPWHAHDALGGGPGVNYTLRGGLDQLPRAVAKSIRDKGGELRLGAAVERIDQSPKHVTVTCRDLETGSTFEVRADRCVCALPIPVLRDKVHLAGAGLSSDKLRLLGELQMMPAGRVYLQTRSRFWREERIEGLQLAGTDTGIERIWHTSNVQPGASGLIHSYVQLHNARAMAQLPAAERTQLVRDEMARHVFPRIRSEWNGLGFARLWAEEEWTGGAWLQGRPEALRAAREVLARPEGRVHFAGEHTAGEGGWMQSAIESGERAAREMLVTQAT